MGHDFVGNAAGGSDRADRRRGKRVNPRSIFRRAATSLASATITVTLQRLS